MKKLLIWLRGLLAQPRCAPGDAQALYSMTERELADLGIGRGEISFWLEGDAQREARLTLRSLARP